MFDPSTKATRQSDFEEERKVAGSLARQAGMAVFDACLSANRVYRKKGGEPFTDADVAANEVICKGLADRFPEDLILSEESEDNLARLDRDRVWIVDPVDGTQELIDGTGQFVVMIGLAIGGAPVVGAVYQPTADRLWVAEVGATAELRTASGPGHAIEVSRRTVDDGVRLVLTRSHAFRGMKELMSEKGISSVETIGSVGLKVMAIASGRADLYLHLSRITREWDTCAPDAILRAAGGVLTDLRGIPLTYNKRQLHNERGIAASNGRVHDWALGKARPFAIRAGLLEDPGDGGAAGPGTGHERTRKSQ